MCQPMKSKIKSINKRFERLQKKDPEKSLEEIYSDQANVLKLIDQYKQDLAKAETSIKDAVNTLKFETIALNRGVKDDKEVLAFVDQSLATCKRLDKSPKKNKEASNSHKGHNHGSKSPKNRIKNKKPFIAKEKIVNPIALLNIKHLSIYFLISATIGLGYNFLLLMEFRFLQSR